MKIFKQYLPFLFLLLSTLVGQAQDLNPNKVEMADLLHQNGKIYLVVLVLVTIFAGIIFLLVRIERRLSKLENKKTNN